MIRKVTIVGTGLIGASIGLAFRDFATGATIAGFDHDPDQRRIAIDRHAIDVELATEGSALEEAKASDLVILAVPVMAILAWIERLAPVLGSHQLVTDVGSTKARISQYAATLYNGPGQARFLPGHPMAGKESGGAALADGKLFEGATWLFTPIAEFTPIDQEWRACVTGFGSKSLDLDPTRHDKVCAWVSHLPQMVSTAIAALLEDELRANPEAAQDFLAIGGRALGEMTRLGASPYSMWRDVAMTNADPIAATLFALEQRFAHIRENLRTPQLREEFQLANTFRERKDKPRP